MDIPEEFDETAWDDATYYMKDFRIWLKNRHNIDVYRFSPAEYTQFILFSTLLTYSESLQKSQKQAFITNIIMVFLTIVIACLTYVVLIR